MDDATRIRELEKAVNMLRLGVLSIQKATLEGKVCDDVAWYGPAYTLHDFCGDLLEASAVGQADMFEKENDDGKPTSPAHA